MSGMLNHRGKNGGSVALPPAMQQKMVMEMQATANRAQMLLQNGAMFANTLIHKGLEPEEAVKQGMVAARAAMKAALTMAMEDQEKATEPAPNVVIQP